MYVCCNDSSHVRKYAISARGHSYGDWVVSVPATESQDGEDIRICLHDSSHTETRIALAKGSEGLAFTLNSAGTAYSVKRDYPYPTGTVYIPAVHNGLPVTAIAGSAFQGCTDIERFVFIGNNLKTVGSNAFATCVNLQSIEFPEGVTSIGSHPFVRCTNLVSVSFPSTVVHLGMNYVDHGAFIGLIMSCPLLENITVAEGNTAYKTDSGCLIEINTNALITGTVNAVIPKYVTEIKRSAFYGSAINSVCIPANVSDIGLAAFSGCTQLKEVTFENGRLDVLGGLMGVIFGGCASLERVELPDNLTAIGRDAFSNCSALREVVFGNNLQIIGSWAFNGCNAIENCEIPTSVTKIYGTSFTGAAFSSITVAEGNNTYFKEGNCIIERLTGTLVAGGDGVVNIPDYITLIGNYAFYGRKIDGIVIPSAVQSIEDYAFYRCASLKSVYFNIGSQLEFIGKYAFAECTSLSSIMLPEKLREISGSAFYKCSILSSVTFGFSDGMLVYGASALETIGSYAFDFTALKSFEIPSTVTDIGNNVFCGKALTSLTVKEGNKAYKMEEGCLIEISTGRVLVALDGAVLPEETKIIDSYAFYYCTNEKLEIPDGVEKINSYAFSGWTSLQTIVVKGYASQEEADAAWGSAWRYGCNAILIYEG